MTQVKVPSDFPNVLKQYTKSALMTQPADLLAWTVAYFEALDGGDKVPVKRKVEQAENVLTIGTLDMVFRQFHLQKRVSAKRLEVAWVRLGLPLEELDAILTSGRFKRESVNIFKFTTLGSGYLAEGDIKQGMRIFCEIVTDDVDGGASRIPYDIFRQGYQYLAKVYNETSQVEAVLGFVKRKADKHHGFVAPRHFLHKNCPPMATPQ